MTTDVENVDKNVENVDGNIDGNVENRSNSVEQKSSNLPEIELKRRKKAEAMRRYRAKKKATSSKNVDDNVDAVNTTSSKQVDAERTTDRKIVDATVETASHNNKNWLIYVAMGIAIVALILIFVVNKPKSNSTDGTLAGIPYY